MKTNPRETDEREKRAVRIASLCVVCAVIMIVWSLTRETRTLALDMERLNAAYIDATEGLRETTALLESFIEDMDAFALSDDASASAD